MASFAYSAQDEKGKSVNGQIEAASEIDAITQIQRQGLLILSIRQETASQEKKGGVLSMQIKLFEEKVATADLIFVAEQLALLLKGGVPLLQGLKLLGGNIGSPPLKAAIAKIAEDVAAGSSFKNALGRHPKVFPDIFTAMVEAGEISGQLPQTLVEVSNYLNQRDSLRGKIVTAMMYPSIMMGMSIFVLFFFIFKIVPVFTNIFESFNLKLPPVTLAVVFISKFLVGNIVYIVGVIIIANFILKAYLKTEEGQMAKGRFMLGIPMLGVFIRNIFVEQFLTNFSLLLKSGVDVLNTLTILEKLLSGNRLFSRSVIVARDKIKSGGTISQGFSQTKVFPDLVQQMMAIGEESGRLSEILDALAGYYRRLIEQFIARLSAVIDPIMILGVGVIVTVIVLAVFLPIFELTNVGTKQPSP